jgi:hypothetical protein
MKIPPSMQTPKPSVPETTLSLEGLMIMDLKAWTVAKQAIESARARAAAALPYRNVK